MVRVVLTCSAFGDAWRGPCTDEVSATDTAGDDSCHATPITSAPAAGASADAGVTRGAEAGVDVDEDEGTGTGAGVCDDHACDGIDGAGDGEALDGDAAHAAG